MFLLFFKLLRAAYPYVKESLFGKKPIPEVIYQNKVTFIFGLSTLFYFAITLFFVDVVIDLSSERDDFKQKLFVSEQKVIAVEKDLTDTKTELDKCKTDSGAGVYSKEFTEKLIEHCLGK